MKGLAGARIGRALLLLLLLMAFCFCCSCSLRLDGDLESATTRLEAEAARLRAALPAVRAEEARLAQEVREPGAVRSSRGGIGSTACVYTVHRGGGEIAGWSVPNRAHRRSACPV